MINEARMANLSTTITNNLFIKSLRLFNRSLDEYENDLLELSLLNFSIACEMAMKAVLTLGSLDLLLTKGTFTEEKAFHNKLDFIDFQSTIGRFNKFIHSKGFKKFSQEDFQELRTLRNAAIHFYIDLSDEVKHKIYKIYRNCWFKFVLVLFWLQQEGTFENKDLFDDFLTIKTKLNTRKDLLLYSPDMFCNTSLNTCPLCEEVSLEINSLNGDINLHCHLCDFGGEDLSLDEATGMFLMFKQRDLKKGGLSTAVCTNCEEHSVVEISRDVWTCLLCYSDFDRNSFSSCGYCNETFSSEIDNSDPEEWHDSYLMGCCFCDGKDFGD